jgi:LacI family gluconate utilization system Gnt-I transcriptional repressor
LEQAAIPVVETWDLPKSPVQHVVGFSNADATRKLVKYLYGKGYRRIAFIGGSTSRDTRGADRRAGYEATVAELGIGPGRVISFGTPPISMQQGGEAVVRLIEQWPEVEAAICVSDLSAFGAVMECQRRKWPVPKRIAIAGFGDFEVASCCVPSITTVGVHCYDIGHKAGNLLIRAIEGARSARELATETIITDYQVIARESA